ncbi:MAG: thioredoxin domain-containing protein [Brevundimonas sp.]
MSVVRRALAGLVLCLALPLAAAAQPAPLTGEDRVMGRADAPVTLIAYVSTTCSHCADWYVHVFDDLEDRFIAPGYVRIAFREIMTAPVEPAFAATAIARCAPGDAYFDVLAQLFHDHEALLRTGQVRSWLMAGGRAGGLDETAVTACLGDEAGLQRVQARWARAGDDGVRSSPTFFINGRRFEGHTFAEFDTELRRLIPNYRSPAREMFGAPRPGG